MAKSSIEKPNIREALKQYEEISLLDQALKELSESAAPQEAAINDAIDRYYDAETSRTLKKMPVEVINREKLGIRVSLLRNAGINNLGELTRLSARDLSRIDGIGESGILRIRTAVKRLVETIRGSLHLRLNVDDITPASDQVVKAINIYQDTEPLRKQSKALYDTYHDRITIIGKLLLKAKGFFRWLFASEETKANAAGAVKYIDRLSQEEYADKARDILDKAEKIRNRTSREYWDDFKRNSPRYYTTLERFPKARISTAASGKMSGLPAELAEKIEKVPVNEAGMKSALRGYQKFGVQYIINQKNVLLGDEMGLGKTVQAIAAMVVRRNAGASNFLVICPASVVVNWCREIEKHSDLKAIDLHKDPSGGLRQWFMYGGVGVTTYESCSKVLLPDNYTYDMLIVDEAHYIKNPLARRTQNVLVLKEKASRALFMTGTALENKVDEMITLLDFLQPVIAAEADSKKALAQAPEFRQIVAPVYFRRTREDVLTELPEMIENEEWCTMSGMELDKYREDVFERHFMGMRRVSWNIDDLSMSSKARRLVELCDSAREDDRKIIVFSFFLDTVKRAKEALGDRCLGPITGSVSIKERQDIIDSFNRAPGGSVLLAQIGAGGTGLNIQAASVVILCEPQLKPSIENQAISRAYRMGQVRNVLVHRLLCENSVDERIMDILQEKQEIFDNFADESVSGKASLKYSDAQINNIIDAEIARLSA